ncbi:MAG TPA: DUF4381 family protein [Desulfobacterales bacterium]|nr:DUF4381 family protein [Desulfobacterales bacterium]
MNPRKPFIKIMFLSLLLLLAAGCQRQAEHSAPLVKSGPEVMRHYRKGPVEMTLAVDHRRINAAQFFHLTLRVEGPENYAFELPGPDTKMPGFSNVGGKLNRPILVGKNRIAQSQTYILEPSGPGKFKLPPLKVLAWNANKDKAKAVELMSTEIPLSVESLFGPDKKGVLSDIEPPVRQPLDWQLWAAAGGGALLLLALIIWLWRRRKPAVPPLPPPLPPAELARRELQRLLERQLPEHGQVKEFYAALSAIIRQYLERNFGIRAPELTTEEFLAELGRRPRGTSVIAGHRGLKQEHRHLLRDFLIHCDLVKFARHQPEVDDIEMAVTICRRFIDETDGSEREVDDEKPLPALEYKS